MKFFWPPSGPSFTTSGATAYILCKDGFDWSVKPGATNIICTVEGDWNWAQINATCIGSYIFYDAFSKSSL